MISLESNMPISTRRLAAGACSLSPGTRGSPNPRSSGFNTWREESMQTLLFITFLSLQAHSDVRDLTLITRAIYLNKLKQMAEASGSRTHR